MNTTPGATADDRYRPTPRLTTETKASVKTTELMAYIGVVVAIIVTALAVGGKHGSPDPFGALDAIRYITYVTIGYMVARGLAKSGSRDAYDAD